jgi:hypothetical protein
VIKILKMASGGPAGLKPGAYIGAPDFLWAAKDES